MSEEKFENAAALEAWLVGKGVDEEDLADEAAEKLYAKKYKKPSTLINIHADALRRAGMLDPVAQSLSNKLKEQQQPSGRSMSNEELVGIITENTKRRENLEREKDHGIPEIPEIDRPLLGEYFKFVNREASISLLLQHAAKQYSIYCQDDGAAVHQIQWAACSGGPGLGKTTFCRKAFTKSIDRDDAVDTLWSGVPTKDSFLPIVQACVETGRQYQISFGGAIPSPTEISNPGKSFSHRLLKCLLKGKKGRTLPFEKAPPLEDLLLRLTKGNKESLIVVNFDETNKLYEMEGVGRTYLLQLLTAVSQFNALQKGFVYCIMSGTNVRDLHDTLKTASAGVSPFEIPLPLLTNEHMAEILENLSIRSSGSSGGSSVRLKIESGLDVVLSALGGVPRYVEVIAFCLGADENGQNFSPSRYAEKVQDPPAPLLLLTDVRRRIVLQYGMHFENMLVTLTKNVWSALVCASLFGWEVDRETQFGNHKVGELESKGVLFVTKREVWFEITFPLIFLTYVLENLSVCPMLLRYFDVPLSSDENERNTLAIFLLKCKGLAAMGRDITVEALLPGYATDLAWRETPLVFNDLSLMLQMENQITLDTWEDFTDSGFFVNAKGAPFADAIIVPQDLKHAILIQEKQVEVAKKKARNNKTVPKFGYGVVKEEHDKCDLELPHLFVFISDKEFEAADYKKIKTNEIVLSRTDHEKSLGPLLALLRLHNHGNRPTLALKKRKRQ